MTEGTTQDSLRTGSTAEQDSTASANPQDQANPANQFNQAKSAGSNGTSSTSANAPTSGATAAPAETPAHAATTVAGTPIATTSDSQDSNPSPATSTRSKLSTRPKRSWLVRRSDKKYDKKDENDWDSSGRSRIVKGSQAMKKGSDLIRSRIASLVWLVAVLAAIVLAVGALLVALDANRDNAIVDFVLDTAHKIDGPFWKVFEFTETRPNGKVVHDMTKEVLVNWGLAAVAYLIAGRILDRIIRP